MISSSVRSLVSPVKTSGSLGTPRNSATTVWVVTAVSTICALALSGALSLMDPPVINRKPVVPFT